MWMFTFTVYVHVLNVRESKHSLMLYKKGGTIEIEV